MPITAHTAKHYTGIIKNTPFYPDIDLALFQTNYRQDNRLEEGTIKNALHSAMLAVNHDLSRWRQRNYPDVQSLLETNDNSIDGENHQVLLYKKAVHHKAKAYLLQDFPDYSLTVNGQNRAEDKNHNSHYHHAESLRAIRQIKGRQGVRVKLIKGSLPLDDFR